MREAVCIAVVAVTGLGCSAGSVALSNIATGAPPAPVIEAEPEAELPWASLTPLERARRAVSEAQMESAAEAAWGARGGPDDSPELRALGARAALAIDCADEAIELARDAADPALLRLIVRAHLTRDRWSDAALFASRPELVGDQDAASVVRVAHAADGLALWQVSGESCAEASWREEARVPVIEVAVNGHDALALLDTTTHVTRVSDALLPDDGVITSLQIGGTTIANVPYFARDLSAARETTTLPIEVVLGRDVLFRWRVAFSNHGPTVRLGGPGLFHWFNRFQAAARILVLDDVPMDVAWQEQGDANGSTNRPLTQFAFDSTHASYLTVTPATRDAMLVPFGDDGFTSGPVRLRVWTSELPGDIDVAPTLRFPAPVGGVLGWPALRGIQLGWRWMSTLAVDFYERDGQQYVSDLRPCEGRMRSGPRTWSRCLLAPRVTQRDFYEAMDYAERDPPASPSRPM